MSCAIPCSSRSRPGSARRSHATGAGRCRPQSGRGSPLIGTSQCATRCRTGQPPRAAMPAGSRAALRPAEQPQVLGPAVRSLLVGRSLRHDSPGPRSRTSGRTRVQPTAAGGARRGDLRGDIVELLAALALAMAQPTGRGICHQAHTLIGMVGRRSLMRHERDADRDLSTAAKEGTRAPEKHELPGQRLGRSRVEVFASYSPTVSMR